MPDVAAPRAYRWRVEGRAWLALSAGLIAGALISPLAPHEALDWQPALAATQPWRAWTAAFVHLSTPHLIANLLATAMVAAYGWAAQVPRRVALSWLLAWPVMHVMLLVQPALLHYGGLSGLMHAGVAAVNAYLVISGSRGQKIIGSIVCLMLVMKVLSETPWQGAIQHSPEWGIPLAPIGHATGLIAGLLLGALIETLHHWPRRNAQDAKRAGA